MPNPETIIIEGQGCTGKTVQAERLADRLRQVGLEAVVTFHPGGIPSTENLRKELLDRKEDRSLTLETEVRLMSQSIQLLYKELVVPSLQEGKWVVSSRWWPSVEVYQGYEQGADLLDIRQKEQLLCEDFKPSLIILLDVEPEEIFKRIINNNNSRVIHAYNEKDMDKIARRQQAYRQLAQQNRDRNWRIVNGVGTTQEIEQRVWQQVEGLI